MAYTLPLLEHLATLHEQSTVAFIQAGDIAFNELHLVYEGVPKAFMYSGQSLFVKPIGNKALEVSGTVQESTDLDVHLTAYSNLDIAADEEELRTPKYMLSYKSWDYHLGHYDPLTDVHTLGLYMASVAFGLDFRKKDDLELFVNNRKRLYFLNKKLHPTILNVIYEMTHLYREDRTVNLQEVSTKLRNYREYNPENYLDLTQTEGFRNQDITERGAWILAKLKNRLFDISRRNKLLYFAERKNFLNLTIASVPLLLDHKNIAENDLIFWNESIIKKVTKTKKLNLNSYLDFKQNRFIGPTLNKIRLEANKSQNEYGFSQMRTVIAFLHWYNFKENDEERITSPLLLVPTSVKKKKGVTDQHTLHFTNTEAEINPILSHYLKELYDIELPGFIDLETTSVEDLVKNIETQIAAGGSGINLEWRKTPRIQLVHTIAKKTFNLRNKSLRNKTTGLNLRDFNYSYTREDFQPLGLQIFNERIRVRNNALEYIINEDLSFIDNKAVAEKVRTFYSTDNDGEINPLVWEVDTCNLTIGNFNYRKMSLVRDYNEIIDANIKDKIFEQLFSETPKLLKPVDGADTALASNYPIIAADPTQTKAIQIARTGESYIIQGPPGTGKSQTITNLIADYVARDKKVLFVCEKRAALDVVFHRLKNKKLDELCCLIHDSQTDKKAFIQNLKQTYESFIDNKLDAKAIEANRKKATDAIDTEVGKLQRFHTTMQSTAEDASPLALYEVLHSTGKHKEPASETDRIGFAQYAEWEQEREWVEEWITKLHQNDFDKQIASYPFAQLSLEITTAANPKAQVLDKLEKSVTLLDSFTELLDELEVPNAEDRALSYWEEKLAFADKLAGIIGAGKFEILQHTTSAAKVFNTQIEKLEKDKRHIENLQEETANWKVRFAKADTTSALAQWNKYSKSIFRFLSPGFYKLKKQVHEAYDFDAHKIEPQIGTLLGTLNKYHEAIALVEEQEEVMEQTYGLADLEEQAAWIKQMQLTPHILLKEWNTSEKLNEIKLLLGFKDKWSQLRADAGLLLGDIDRLSVKELDAKLAACNGALSSLSVFIPLVEKAKKVSPELQNCLYHQLWTLQDFDYQLAYKSLANIYEKQAEFSDTDEDRLQSSIQRVNALLDVYYESNVAIIRSRIRMQFLDKIRVSESVAAQLTQEEKLDKKTYVSARRILENEFGKSMRYKSIRELASSDASVLMNGLKPVWLMSPLSVSDTMPIDTSLFDVVIYDEASQITVEEGVPSLFRTRQTIIVGDEMQMPPTNFFSSSNAVDEEEEETEERIGISLDADSLLNQGGRKLSSVMLGWHYRSRHESLISFSNAAFYKRNLLTIPDCVISDAEQSAPLDTIVDLDAPLQVDEILDRSLSYCYLENAVYEKRTNKDEAKYIAKLVREILLHEVNHSIGIVAFSMDQQSEIEGALDYLAAEDSQFESLLETEYQRMDEDQYNGLFVKNLENVQGDERDIIIMSVCYGSNAKGKMLMNFGPINRRGGEKRLNVIFSRAKKRMVIVTSMQPQEIKNDYNEGANYFKRFLQYAKHISDGRLQDANTILDTMHLAESELQQLDELPLVAQLKQALLSKGLTVDTNVGQSHFKCDLAVKRKGEKTYALGILIDKSSHYANADVIEQYCQKPQILQAFGWKICRVLSKDWLEQPERVLEKIDQLLVAEKVEEKIDVAALLGLESTQPEATSAPRIDDLIKELNSEPESEEEVGEEVTEEPVEEEMIITEGFERYEYIEGNSSKYWQVAVNGNTLEVQYGRIGNNPQVSTKVFDTPEKAEQEKGKMANKKVAKGYKKV